MKRSSFWIPVVGVLALAACGQAELVVVAEAERTDPNTGEVTQQPLQNLPIQLLPFDRDHVFDSLSAEAPSPEPELPAELEEARDEMREYQSRWREAEREWAQHRERLTSLANEMEDYSPAETRYQELFAEFESVEVQYVDAEQRKDEAFARFTTLQQETFDELEQHRLRVEAWEDEAFADYPQVVQQYIEATGREIVADTTDGSGMVRVRVRPGDWWVHARYRLTHSELYWNTPVTAERGDPVEVRLTRENGDERPLN